jgi:hypothetical protein
VKILTAQAKAAFSPGGRQAIQLRSKSIRLFFWYLPLAAQPKSFTGNPL